jgi:UDP-N-acetylglucosamine 1-carboxyvinyltransferase
VDTHLHAFRALGADIEAERVYRMRHSGLRGAEVFLDEASVSATENALCAAAVADGETVIMNAACEPHVQDHARILVALGAQIEGIGTNEIRVRGVERLSGGRFRIGPDHIEIASFIGLAAVTGSDLEIVDVRPEDLRMIRLTFERMGIRVEMNGSRLRVPPEQDLRIVADEGEAIPKIDDGPWPAFPADLTSIATAVATQANGTVMIFEKMFENRLFFVDKLVAMGARIVLCDPHRAVVSGPSQLYGEPLVSPDIRAGMALLIAALAAKGTSTIGNVSQIDRGYERIDTRLRALGARIERVPA